MPMQYFFTEEDGKKTQVELERWAWAVLYQDGTQLKQFADDGVFHRVGEIDQDRLSRVWLYKTEDPSKILEIAWCTGMKLVHKYRNFVFEAGSECERRARVYMFGWKYEGKHALFCVLPDDRIVVAPDDEVPLTAFGI